MGTVGFFLRPVEGGSGGRETLAGALAGALTAALAIALADALASARPTNVGSGDPAGVEVPYVEALVATPGCWEEASLDRSPERTITAATLAATRTAAPA